MKNSGIGLLDSSTCKRLDAIDLHHGTSTGESLHYQILGGAKHTVNCGIRYFTDRSNAFKYRLNHPMEHSSWATASEPMVMGIYLEESKKYFRPESGYGQWQIATMVTPSPQVDPNGIRLFFETITSSITLDLGEKRIVLNEKYSKEKQKYFHYFKNIPEEYIDKLFRSASDVIIQLPYSEIAIEITRDNALFFELRLNDLILHFKLILSQPEPKGFFALYKNSTPLDNGVGPIDDILNRLLDIKTHARLPASFITKKHL